MDYHGRGKCFIHGPKHYKENKLLSLKHPCWLFLVYIIHIYCGREHHLIIARACLKCLTRDSLVTPYSVIDLGSKLPQEKPSHWLDDNKPSPEPMSINHQQCPVPFIWEQYLTTDTSAINQLDYLENFTYLKYLRVNELKNYKL